MRRARLDAGLPFKRLSVKTNKRHIELSIWSEMLPPEIFEVCKVGTALGLHDLFRSQFKESSVSVYCKMKSPFNTGRPDERFNAGTGQHLHDGVRALQRWPSGGQNHIVRSMRPRVSPILLATTSGACSRRGVGLPDLHSRGFREQSLQSREGVLAGSIREASHRFQSPVVWKFHRS